MLYAQLNRINEVDKTITNLHRQLAALYAERADIVASGQPAAAEADEPAEAQRTGNTYKGERPFRRWGAKLMPTHYRSRSATAPEARSK